MIFQLDKAIKQFFCSVSGLTYNDTPSLCDVIVSSNSWAFRNRIVQTGLNSIKFPFINFRILPAGITRTETTSVKNWQTSVEGLWDDTLETRVECKAFLAKYEATFWCTGYSNALYAFQRFFYEDWNDNTIDYTYNIKGQDLVFKSLIEFSNLEFDPQWEESAELEKGKIHSIDLSFEVQSYLFTNKNDFSYGVGTYNTAYPCNVYYPNHGLNTRDIVGIVDSVNNEINGSYKITVVDENNFTLDGCDNRDGVGGTATWYLGVAPLNQLEVELFYSNGVIDNQDTPDRTFTITGS